MAKCQAKALPEGVKQGEFIPNTDVLFPKKLPILSRGQKPTQADMVKLATFVCDLYGEDRHPLAECLKMAGIRSEATWMKWARENKVVKEMYERAKRQKAEVYRGRLRERALSSAEKQLTGYKVPLEEVTESVEVVFPRDEQGNIIPDAEPVMEVVTSRTIKRRQVYVKPSPTITLGILWNTDPQNFNRNPQPWDDSPGIPQRIEVEIVDARPPVTDESEIEDIEFEE